jgi:hypothetical protein
LISGFPSAKHRLFIKKTERSDTIILGILAHFRNFRHFSGLSGYGCNAAFLSYYKKTERSGAIILGIFTYTKLNRSTYVIAGSGMLYEKYDIIA